MRAGAGPGAGSGRTGAALGGGVRHTLTDDLGRKRALYAAAAVPEYWVVDVFGRALHQYWTPADGVYARSAVVPFGGTVRSATLAGLAVPTATLDVMEDQG